jgi:hypothetical protein
VRRSRESRDVLERLVVFVAFFASLWTAFVPRLVEVRFVHQDQALNREEDLQERRCLGVPPGSTPRSKQRKADLRAHVHSPKWG